MDLTHNLETCKELNLSAEYRQMKSKLETERDELNSDYLAKKKRRKKREFSKHKTLLPMDSCSSIPESNHA